MPVAITVLAALLRFFRLGRQSLWIDEVLTLGASDPAPPGIPFVVKLLWDVHGPLYTLVIHLWRAACESDAWLRLPGAVFGVATVPLMYAWVKRETDRGTGLVAALLMALSPFNVYYSQELRFYALLTMMTVASLLAFRAFSERPSARRGALLGIVLGLACLSHLMALFLCAGFAVALAAGRNARGAHLRWGLMAAVIALVIASPWIYRQAFFLQRISDTQPELRPVVQRMEEGRFPPLAAYPYTFYAFATGFSFGPDLRELRAESSPGALISRHAPAIGLAALVFGSVLVAGLARLRRDRNLSLFISVPAVTILLVTLAAILKIKVFNARYLMPAFPVFMAVLACGTLRRSRSRNVAVIAALSILMLVSTANYHFSPRYARDDIKGAVRLIVGGERPGDVIVAPGVEPVVSWYYCGERPLETLYAPRLERRWIEQRLARIMDEKRRLWYLRCRPWDTDAEGHIRDILFENLPLSNAWELPGVNLYLFEIPSGDG